MDELDEIDDSDSILAEILREYNITGVQGLPFSADLVDSNPNEVNNVDNFFNGTRCRVVSLCGSRNMHIVYSLKELAKI